MSQEQITYYDFWYTYVKWWYLQAFCLFFLILIFGVVRGVKGQKMVQNDKNYVCSTPFLRNHTWYGCHLWCTCVKRYLQVFFFYFFKILIFLVVKEVKGQKIVQNDKKIICPAPYFWKIIHHMIVIYGTHW